MSLLGYTNKRVLPYSLFTHRELSDECLILDHDEFGSKPTDLESRLNENKDLKRQDIDPLELGQAGSKASALREENGRQGDGYVGPEEDETPVPNPPDFEEISKVEESITDDVPLASNQQEDPKVPEEAEQGSSAPQVLPKVAKKNTISSIENSNVTVCPTGEVEQNVNNRDYTNANVREEHLPNSKGTQKVAPKLPKYGIINEECTKHDVPENPVDTVSYRTLSQETPSPESLVDATTKFVEQREGKPQQTFSRGDEEESCVQQATTVSQSRFEGSNFAQCQPEQRGQQHLHIPEQQQHTTTHPLEGEIVQSRCRKIEHSIQGTTESKERERGSTNYNAVLTNSQFPDKDTALVFARPPQVLYYELYTAPSKVFMPLKHGGRIEQIEEHHNNRPDLTDLSDEWMEVTPPPSPHDYEATPSPNPCLFVSSICYLTSSLGNGIRAQNSGMPLNETAALVSGMIWRHGVWNWDDHR